MNIHQELPSNLEDFVSALSDQRDGKTGAIDTAISFLKFLDPDGWHSLVAINPETKVPTGRTFAPGQWPAMEDWLSAHVSVDNCYYSLNEPKPGSPDKKLTKGDIGAIRAIAADIDPEKDVGLDVARFAIRSRVERERAGKVPPSIAIDSGGGFQMLWKLSAKLPRDGNEEWAEDQGRAMADYLGGDNVQNIDRVLRLPGPLNIPDQKKRDAGRISRHAEVLYQNSQLYTESTLAALIAPVEAHTGYDCEGAVAEAFELIDFDNVECNRDFEDLPAELQHRFNDACRANPKMSALWRGDATSLLGSDRSSSAWRCSLAKLLARAWSYNFDAMDYAQLVYVWPHLADDREKMDHRQLSRDWGRMAAPETSEAMASQWFEDIPEPAEALFPEEQTSQRNDVFKFLTINDIANRPDPKYLIGRYIPENSLGFIYAMSGAGKTFLALDIALSLAYGRPDWHGEVIRAPDNATVVYIAGEGVSGLKARIAAWKHHYGIAIDDDADGRFLLLPQAVNMMAPEQVEKLTRSIRLSVNGSIAAIFIDTVSRAIPGADENLQKEMSKFIEACETVKRGANSAVIGIHHTNKAGDMRGSGVLDGGLDFIFKLTRTKGASIGKLYCEKMKDGPDGWFDHFSFNEVTTSEGNSSL
ncbi:MAG: AAA family ATPase, partial [Phyllobacterium sp.]